MSVWLARLVKALAALTHVRLCVQEGSIPRAYKLDSGFHLASGHAK